MLYLLFVLTFIAGILFYGMAPREDRLELNARQAEGMILSFVNQHQAARDYLFTWLGAGTAGAEGSNVQSGGYLQPEFIQMMPGKRIRYTNGGSEIHKSNKPEGISIDMCDNNRGTPGVSNGGCNFTTMSDINTAAVSTVEDIPGFVSRVVDADGKHYVITYGGWEPCGESDFCRPSWWPREGQRMRKYESWRRAITKRTRGSKDCGVLFKNGSTWCIDNGQTVFKDEGAGTPQCAKKVPQAIIDAMPNDYKPTKGLEDLLFCMSEFNQGLTPPYEVGIQNFFDGLSNRAFGHHLTGTKDWKDLTKESYVRGEHFPEKGPYADITTPISSGIQFGSKFTLTVLVKMAGLSAGFNILSRHSEAGYAENTAPVFYQKAGEDSQYCLKLNPEGVDEDEKCIKSCNKSTNIISWTFVVNGNNVSVYENATFHFTQNLTGGTFPSKYLFIGGSGQSADIYGIRYYDKLLGEKEIKKNFHVDQKRFGIPDTGNGQIRNGC